MVPVSKLTCNSGPPMLYTHCQHWPSTRTHRDWFVCYHVPGVWFDHCCNYSPVLLYVVIKWFFDWIELVFISYTCIEVNKLRTTHSDFIMVPSHMCTVIKYYILMIQMCSLVTRVFTCVICRGGICEPFTQCVTCRCGMGGSVTVTTTKWCLILTCFCLWKCIATHSLAHSILAVMFW